MSIYIYTRNTRYTRYTRYSFSIKRMLNVDTSEVLKAVVADVLA